MEWPLLYNSIFKASWYKLSSKPGPKVLWTFMAAPITLLPMVFN